MTETLQFSDFSLNPIILKTLKSIGYEQPSPIQSKSIPALLEGHDVLGMAQTGTGKTAAFALPLLHKINTKERSPQALILTPTRELAIQVAEALQHYAAGLTGFHVLPIYGGQDMSTQLRQLQRGVHVIVGTPGRVMDHLRRKSLDLASIKHVVLDEADEMLRMGFIEDVTWILDHAPKDRQTALFSATMPKQIQKVAETYLKDPQIISIESSTTTVKNIEQHAWIVKGVNKLDALTRVLEIEPFDAVIVFVRTKTATAELAERLEARGHATAALNGDMSQVMRERTVERLKKGSIDIVVATDVAARGIDVPRISHVINYDIPYDTEAYVHRIGRTGRAGRSGKAILFVAPREKRMLASIERATRQPIELMQLPSREQITHHRTEQFKRTVAEVLGNEDLDFFDALVLDICKEQQILPEDLAKALAFIAQKDNPIHLPERKERSVEEPSFADSHATSPPRPKRERERERGRGSKQGGGMPMQTFRMEVGKSHGATARDVVGALANEVDIDPQYIGQIKLHDNFTTVELPSDMPKEVFAHLQKVRIRNQKIALSIDAGSGAAPNPKKLRKGPPADLKSPEDGKKPFKDRAKPAKDGKKSFKDGKKSFKDGAKSAKESKKKGKNAP